MKHIFVIDDTGSPGNSDETRFLKENRKTLVGVFIHSKNREHLEQTIKEVVLTLNKRFGITELHLTDLANKKNEYSQISNEDRLEIMKLLSKWFSNIQLPYFVQTCTDKTFVENGIPLKGKLANFNFNKGEDQALFLLITSIKKFMDEHFPNEKVEIVMDEGRKKNNQIEQFKGFSEFIHDGNIKYFSSKGFVLLQIADFFAYSINRTQMSIIKEKKTEFDIKLYEYLIAVLEIQFSVGNSFIEADFESFTKDDYDYHQHTQKQIDGNLESWKNSQ
jgi:hypothetical protein